MGLFDHTVSRAQIKDTYWDYLTRVYKKGANSVRSELPEWQPFFDEPDYSWLRTMKNQGERTFNNYFGDVGERIRHSILQSYASGRNIQQAQNDLQKTFNYSADRANKIVRTETARITNAARLNQYDKNEAVDEVELFAERDGAHCSGWHDGGTCQSNNGRIYPKREARGLLPAHVRCFDKETEVYTDQGWKYFKDLNNEKIWALNPETFIPEWVDYVKYISYHYRGQMIHFKSMTMDQMVTPNHHVFAGKRSDYKDRKYINWQLREADSFKLGKFYKGVKWVGKEPQYYEFNEPLKITHRTRSQGIHPFKIPIETYCKFMGYYLSEGSVTHRYANLYSIKIAQSNQKNLQIIWDDLKIIPGAYLAKDYVGFSNPQMGHYLKQFGKSWEKFIPNEIKELSLRLIEIYLAAHCLGDGHIKKGKNWKGHQFSDSRIFDTSSSKMASDLGELMMKIGKSCSYKFDERTNNTSKFPNGKIYQTKHHCWRISELKNIHVEINSSRVYEVDYDDFVYDVELEKYHILLTRRNGKVVWSGNCRCAWIPVVRAELLASIKPEEPDDLGLSTIFEGGITDRERISQAIKVDLPTTQDKIIVGAITDEMMKLPTPLRNHLLRKMEDDTFSVILTPQQFIDDHYQKESMMHNRVKGVLNNDILNANGDKTYVERASIGGHRVRYDELGHTNILISKGERSLVKIRSTFRHEVSHYVDLVLYPQSKGTFGYLGYPDLVKPLSDSWKSAFKVYKKLDWRKRWTEDVAITNVWELYAETMARAMGDPHGTKNKLKFANMYSLWTNILDAFAFMESDKIK